MVAGRAEYVMKSSRAAVGGCYVNHYSVTIPCWTEGVPLHINNITAESGHKAWAWVVDYVNRRAGFHYCDDLPFGSTLTGPHGLLIHERGLFDAGVIDGEILGGNKRRLGAADAAAGPGD